MSQEFCPDPITRIENLNDPAGGAKYLYDIIDTAEEWAVNIDIDCFLIHPPSVTNMIGEMGRKGFTHCGVHDGGSIDHRPCAWCVTQPFFNIFNAKEIRSLKKKSGLAWSDVEKFAYKEEWNARIPPTVTGNWDANRYEKFYGFFFFLFEHGSPMFLDSMPMGDGISTAVIWSNRIIAYHTWFAREFETRANPEKRGSCTSTTKRKPTRR